MKLKTIGVLALFVALCLWASGAAMAQGGRGMGGGMGGGGMGGMGAGGMGGHGMMGSEMGDSGHGHDDESYEQGHGHKKHGKHAEQEEAGNLEGPFFNERNKHALRSRYGKGLPPGLQKHLDRTGHLPPGLEMQLQRKGHLPPGLERGDLYPLSPKEAKRFGTLPPNSKLYLYGRDAILLNEHTGAVIDILRNAY